MVKLVPIKEAEFQDYIDASLAGFAEEQVRSGAWKREQMAELMARTLQHLLPQGFSTPDQFFHRIVDDESGKQVGYLWYGLAGSEARRFVMLYDLNIAEPCRRQGYASGALQALEKVTRDLGIGEIQLHVFGHNETARALYNKVGYIERNVTMVKKLD